MRTVIALAGAAMVLAGLVWLAQGLNLAIAPRSFMTADRSWILIGPATIVAGIVLLAWARAMR